MAAGQRLSAGCCCAGEGPLTPATAPARCTLASDTPGVSRTGDVDAGTVTSSDPRASDHQGTERESTACWPIAETPPESEPANTQGEPEVRVPLSLPHQAPEEDAASCPTCTRSPFARALDACGLGGRSSMSYSSGSCGSMLPVTTSTRAGIQRPRQPSGEGPPQAASSDPSTCAPPLLAPLATSLHSTDDSSPALSPRPAVGGLAEAATASAGRSRVGPGSQPGLLLPCCPAQLQQRHSFHAGSFTRLRGGDPGLAGAACGAGAAAAAAGRPSTGGLRALGPQGPPLLPPTLEGGGSAPHAELRSPAPPTLSRMAPCRPEGGDDSPSNRVRAGHGAHAYFSAPGSRTASPTVPRQQHYEHVSQGGTQSPGAQGQGQAHGTQRHHSPLQQQLRRAFNAAAGGCMGGVQVARRPRVSWCGADGGDSSSCDGEDGGCGAAAAAAASQDALSPVVAAVAANGDHSSPFSAAPAMTCALPSLPAEVAAGPLQVPQGCGAAAAGSPDGRQGPETAVSCPIPVGRYHSQVALAGGRCSVTHGTLPDQHQHRHQHRLFLGRPNQQQQQQQQQQHTDEQAPGGQPGIEDGDGGGERDEDRDDVDRASRPSRTSRASRGQHGHGTPTSLLSAAIASFSATTSSNGAGGGAASSSRSCAAASPGVGYGAIAAACQGIVEVPTEEEETTVLQAEQGGLFCQGHSKELLAKEPAGATIAGPPDVPADVARQPCKAAAGVTGIACSIPASDPALPRPGSLVPLADDGTDLLPAADVFRLASSPPIPVQPRPEARRPWEPPAACPPSTRTVLPSAGTGCMPLQWLLDTATTAGHHGMPPAAPVGAAGSVACGGSAASPVTYARPASNMSSPGFPGPPPPPAATRPPSLHLPLPLPAAVPASHHHPCPHRLPAIPPTPVGSYTPAAAEAAAASWASNVVGDHRSLLDAVQSPQEQLWQALSTSTWGTLAGSRTRGRASCAGSHHAGHSSTTACDGGGGGGGMRRNPGGFGGVYLEGGSVRNPYSSHCGMKSPTVRHGSAEQLKMLEGAQSTDGGMPQTLSLVLPSPALPPRGAPWAAPGTAPAAVAQQQPHPEFRELRRPGSTAGRVKHGSHSVHFPMGRPAPHMVHHAGGPGRAVGGGVGPGAMSYEAAGAGGGLYGVGPAAARVHPIGHNGYPLCHHHHNHHHHQHQHHNHHSQWQHQCQHPHLNQGVPASAGGDSPRPPDDSGARGGACGGGGGRGRGGCGGTLHQTWSEGQLAGIAHGTARPIGPGGTCVTGAAATAAAAAAAATGAFPASTEHLVNTPGAGPSGIRTGPTDGSPVSDASRHTASPAWPPQPTTRCMSFHGGGAMQTSSPHTVYGKGPLSELGDLRGGPGPGPVAVSVFTSGIKAPLPTVLPSAPSPTSPAQGLAVPRIVQLTMRSVARAVVAGTPPTRPPGQFLGGGSDAANYSSAASSSLCASTADVSVRAGQIRTMPMYGSGGVMTATVGGEYGSYAKHCSAEPSRHGHGGAGGGVGGVEGVGGVGFRGPSTNGAPGGGGGGAGVGAGILLTGTGQWSINESGSQCGGGVGAAAAAVTAGLSRPFGSTMFAGVSLDGAIHGGGGDEGISAALAIDPNDSSCTTHHHHHHHHRQPHLHHARCPDGPTSATPSVPTGGLCGAALETAPSGPHSDWHSRIMPSGAGESNSAITGYGRSLASPAAGTQLATRHGNSLDLCTAGTTPAVSEQLLPAGAASGRGGGAGGGTVVAFASAGGLAGCVSSDVGEAGGGAGYGSALGDGEGGRWFEVTISSIAHPATGESLLLVVQHDVSTRVWAERQLARVAEAEHALLENIFPQHVLEHIAVMAATAAMPADDPSDGNNGNTASDDRLRDGSPEGEAQAAGTGTGTGTGAAAGGVRHQATRLPLTMALAGPPVPITGDTFLHLATSHSAVTVLFCDIQGFTTMCNQVKPATVMAFLNDLYTRLDAMLDAFGVYKVETIGDCYVAAGGLMKVDEETGAVTVRSDDVDPQHAHRTVQFAKSLLRAASAVRLPTTGEPVRLRVGIHSGPAMSGVVGTRMPRFCLFGDTINTASRMESTGVPGAIHVSQATHDLVPDEDWEPTGGVEAKGKGLLQTYILRPH